MVEEARLQYASINELFDPRQQFIVEAIVVNMTMFVIILMAGILMLNGKTLYDLSG